MRSLYGFVELFSLIDNVDTMTDYELTSALNTYAVDIKRYPAAQHITHVFNTDGITNAETAQTASVIANVMNALLSVNGDQSIAATMEQLRAAMLVRLSGTIGELLMDTVTVDGKLYPASISFKTQQGVYCKLWTKQATMLVEYPYYTITIIPPISNVDALLTDSGVVSKLRSTSDMFAEVHRETVGRPPTAVLVENVSIIINGVLTTVPFGVVIHGNGVNKTLAHKKAIEQYITEHSALNVELWRTAMPALWGNAEATVIVKWDSIAIPNYEEDTGIPSSVFDVAEYTLIANALRTQDPARYTHSSLILTSFPFQNIGIGILYSNEHLKNVTFRTDFPDYLPYTAVNPLYPQMSQLTRDWVGFMQTLLRKALSPSNAVDGEILIVNSQRFVVGEFDGREWRILL